MHKLIFCLTVAALLPACATAQHPDSVQARNRCRLALQVVETGHPEPHTAWAYERVGLCGPEAGPAVAGALRRFRQNQDTTVLDLISTPARYLRDAQIFDAALEIAQDRTASVPARVFAFRTLIQALVPGTMLRYSNLSGGGCFGLGPHLHQETIEGAALPSDYPTRIGAVAAAVASDPQSAPQTRRAAVCTSLHLRRLPAAR
jgi:hypothetical protein